MNVPQRRFTEKAELDPTAVRGLPAGHPALIQNRTLFPSTVVEVTKDVPDRILVSGANNRKLGDKIIKGKFAGYALYGLSLEERATCPTDCSVRDICYGNGMQMARRHRIGDRSIFFDRVGLEIVDLLEERDGLMVRLHVLGDFPDIEYVAFWADMLADNDRLACYGYTHRMTTAWGGSEIGDAIQAVKDNYPDRFRIRWSSRVARSDGAMVINYVPRQARTDDGIVCPAQTEATACCASCGLCWESKHDSIVFIKHGMKSHSAAAAFERAKGDDEIEVDEEIDKILIGLNLPMKIEAPRVDESRSTTRSVVPIDLPANLKPRPQPSPLPEVRVVKPTDLRVEAAYQRDLSGKSIKLIRKIVDNWEWAKFKPPVCAETLEGLFVIDGQHTAIAAASNPHIREIPVLVVKNVERVQDRADAFVSHNRDRLAMSALQVFHAEVAANNPSAISTLKIALTAGCEIPRFVPPKGQAKPRTATAITAMQRVLKTDGEAVLLRVLKIAVLADVTPIASTIVYALQLICKGQAFAQAAAASNERLADAIKSLGDIESVAQDCAVASGQNRYRAFASLIASCIEEKEEVA